MLHFTEKFCITRHKRLHLFFFASCSSNPMMRIFLKPPNAHIKTKRNPAGQTNSSFAASGLVPDKLCQKYTPPKLLHLYGGFNVVNSGRRGKVSRRAAPSSSRLRPSKKTNARKIRNSTEI